VGGWRARGHVGSLPWRVRFRGVREREALLFEGPKGWGEFSPFLEYGVPESAEWLRGGLGATEVTLPATPFTCLYGYPRPVRLQ